MLKRTASLPFLWRDVNVAVYQAPSSPLQVYQNVRHNSGSKFHDHWTYNKLGNTRPRKGLIDPKLLKVGEPVSASIIMGDMVKAREFEFDVQALNARGFLRFQKAYTPPPNATGTLLELCRSCLDVKGDEAALLTVELADPRKKYDLLAKAFETFEHGVPNSMLHMMNTIGDIIEFYNTPIKTTTPYEELARCDDLPPNLHIQKEPLRFHPETDTMFRGESAFPKSSTIVTGLRSRKMYRGHEAKMTWP